MTITKVCVLQQGARHRYAIPELYSSAGCLSQFITDSNRSSRLGIVANLFSSAGLRFSSLNRLLNRTPSVRNTDTTTVSFADRWFVYQHYLRRLKESNLEKWLTERDRLWYNCINTFVRWDKIDVIYSIDTENLRLLKVANEKGKGVIVDAIISPLAMRKTFLEKKKFNVAPSHRENNHSREEEYYKKVYHAADIILAPSEYVKSGICELDKSFASKIMISPYGASLPPRDAVRAPKKHRIFWAGRDVFRKGLYTIAKIAEKLSPLGYEFRVAGFQKDRQDLEVRKAPLTFLGNLNSESMREEFSNANLFLFPTISEGQAGVVIEALANGCPVLTTRSSGVGILENDHKILTISDYPISDISAWTSTVRDLCDRTISVEPAESKTYRDFYSMESWRDRLVMCAEECVKLEKSKRTK